MNITTNKVPDWANGCPMWIVEKALKDLSYYQGLTIKVGLINVAPTGAFHLDDFIYVTVTGMDFMEFNSGWADAFWKVSLSPEAEATIRTQIEVGRNVSLDPYLPAFSYEIDPAEKHILCCYRAWMS